MDKRYRNWATVIYPESAYDNWLDYLRELKSPVFVSPLHDKDTNPDGEKKKEHYHILFTFEGKKSQEQIKEITEKIGAVGQEPVNSLRGYARYLCHLDNPEKYQYSENDIQCFGGADYGSVIGLVTDRYKAFKEMQEFVVSQHIVVFAQLADYAANERMDWYRILCDSGTVFMKEYIKSYAWYFQNKLYKREV